MDACVSQIGPDAGTTEIEGVPVSFYGDPFSRRIFLQPCDAQDLPVMEAECRELRRLCGRGDWCLAAFRVKRWEKDLTPWGSPPVFGKESFGNGAPSTLSFLLEKLMPYIDASFPVGGRRFDLCGYSLAGLFALWAACQTGVFPGVAAVSPSVWYPGWTEYAALHPVKAKSVYLSLGKREEKTKNKTMARVGEAIGVQYDLLKKAGTTCLLEWNEGDHFVDSALRTAKGLSWLIKTGSPPGGE